MDQSVWELLRKPTALPTMPGAALLVLERTEATSLEMADLADAIAKDPALAAKLLQSVNSGFYGMQHKVSSLTQAVTMLGLHSVKMLVLSFSLLDTLRKDQPQTGFNHQAYWQRSMYTATAARVIAERAMPTRLDDCFIAGLLMDIGMLALDRVLGSRYGALHRDSGTPAELLLRESYELGASHPEAGAYLAQQWKLPSALQTVIGSHHNPDSVEDVAHEPLCRLVSLADRCADIFLVQNPAETISHVRKLLHDHYRISDTAADNMLCDIGHRTRELVPLFEITLEEKSDYQAIRDRASARLLELALAEQDSRRTTRVRREGRMTLRTCVGGILGDEEQIQLRDISIAGIGLIHTRAMKPGCQFVIQLAKADGASKTLLYSVVRCEPKGQVFQIGAALTTVLRSGGRADRTIDTEGALADDPSLGLVGELGLPISPARAGSAA